MVSNRNTCKHHSVTSQFMLEEKGVVNTGGGGGGHFIKLVITDKYSDILDFDWL